MNTVLNCAFFVCFSDGAISDSSRPPRRMISIAFVLPIMAIPAGMMIVATNATIKVSVVAVVCVIACRYR